MRKLIVQMQMSVDGYVSAANDELDWQVWNWGEDWTWDDALKNEFNRIFASVDGILLSRPMVQQGYLNHWGRAATRFPTNPNYAFAQRIVDLPKFVVTDKLDASLWERTTIVRGGMAAAVGALKQQPGGNLITFGGKGFVSALIAAGLVDEFQFFVNPVAVGSGGVLFHDTRHGTRLRLIRSDSYACGIVVNRYVPA
ncbi:dihydrofolate reductase family protein [Pandoraea apista]|uniref:Deaminase n=1 Tax=Pandoraea apista TaxID=93218 RepID=A0ABX9ZR55_9BURK|nr:dihydrofolate reductase family protein [Pandoraea apista]PTE00425.1 deaminase [Pandoraea apista]RRJ28451.1 deaminase [Pandoraea apista]RRJ74174.1 deaminase [Pandoraea apista]RSD12670.1 deaminase [Pandoraea apista]RSD18643.1 deaminase [Pandoraea apista]